MGNDQLQLTAQLHPASSLCAILTPGSQKASVSVFRVSSISAFTQEIISLNGVKGGSAKSPKTKPLRVEIRQRLERLLARSCISQSISKAQSWYRNV